MGMPDLLPYATALTVVGTVIVGFLTYRANARASDAASRGAQNQGEIGVIDSAIRALKELGEQQTKEIARLDLKNDECELERVLLKERIAFLEGQIETLTAVTAGAAHEAVERAKEAADAVRVAAANAKAAVAEAAEAAGHALEPEVAE